jgi:hypothetical protein
MSTPDSVTLRPVGWMPRNMLLETVLVEASLGQADQGEDAFELVESALLFRPFLAIAHPSPSRG